LKNPFRYDISEALLSTATIKECSYLVLATEKNERREKKSYSSVVKYCDIKQSLKKETNDKCLHVLLSIARSGDNL
jgi:hypothetical protein